MNKNILIFVLLIVIAGLVYLQLGTINISNKINGLDNKQIIQNEKIELYIEKLKDEETLFGSLGEPVKLVAFTNKPSTIIYTIKYKTGALVPNAIPKEVTEKQTVSLESGRNELSVFSAIDSKVEINFIQIK